MLDKTIAMLEKALTKKAPRKSTAKGGAAYTISDGGGNRTRAFKLTANHEASEAALDYADRLALRGDHPRFEGPGASAARSSWHRTR